MYDRRVGDRELNFEASGALMKASLVMRDRETDSWWSIMTSDAIGGKLEGKDLKELPLGEKATWKEWVIRYPKTLVLSVDGVEHDPQNPYDNYFSSEGTFRDLKISDKRLEPKTPIFSFWHGGKPYAAAYKAFEGGQVFKVRGIDDRVVLLYREPGASLFASTQAYLVDTAALGKDRSAKNALALVESAEPQGVERLSGFDTFWYSWISINTESELLR